MLVPRFYFDSTKSVLFLFLVVNQIFSLRRRGGFYVVCASFLLSCPSPGTLVCGPSLIPLTLSCTETLLCLDPYLSVSSCVGVSGVNR